MRSFTLPLVVFLATALPAFACDYGMTGTVGVSGGLVGVPLAAPAFQTPMLSPYYAPTVPLAQFAPSYSFAAQTYAAPAFAPSYAPAFAPAFAPFATSYGASSYGLSAFAAPSYSYSAFPSFGVRSFNSFGGYGAAFSPGVSVDVLGGRFGGRGVFIGGALFNTFGGFGGRTVIRTRFR